MRYRIGDRVFVSGSSGIVAAVNANGSYVVDMTYGETITAWPGEMALHV